jgi:hypothetical protein
VTRPIGLALTLLLCGCAAPLKIDAGKMTASTATLEIRSPEQASYVTIPLISYKYVEVTLSRLTGCDAKADFGAKLDELGKARLTPKSVTQSVSIPAGIELAIYAESTENVGGNIFSCGRAVRFTSETGAIYRLHFTPQGSTIRQVCDLQLFRDQDGKEVPVANAFYAVREPVHLLSGGNLNLCWREDHPQ